MSRAAFLILIAAACLLIATSSAHAEDPVVVDLRVDAPRVVTVGDHVTYTVVLEADAGTGVELAGAGLPPEVALVDRPVTERIPLAGGREQVTLRFQIAPFVPGEIAMPPLTLRYTGADGSTGTVDTLGSAISVTSVLPGAGQPQPRDLKPQAEIGAPPPTWPLPVGVAIVGALVLAIVAVFVRRRVRKYHVARALRRVPVYAGPEDEARARLDEAAAAYRASGDLTAYYTALGNTTRRYLTQRYAFPAFALTTRELDAEMLQRGLDRWQIRVATGLLSQCDAVIYARYRPAAERADADLTAAYEVVEMSRPEERPRPEPEEVAVS